MLETKGVLLPDTLNAHSYGSLAAMHCGAQRLREETAGLRRLTMALLEAKALLNLERWNEADERLRQCASMMGGAA